MPIASYRARSPSPPPSTVNHQVANEFIFWETEDGIMIDATTSFRTSRWSKVSFISFALPDVSPKPAKEKAGMLNIEDETTWKAFNGSLLAKIRSNDIDRTMLCIGIIKIDQRASPTNMSDPYGMPGRRPR
ncbi:hypothetical protein Hypma_009247 [Hypsizygus marmoreus]|uniref:Uncharacterized protein n=1 Tax=Hypsizygus marmoreus TaxID=39966 RepID=A0A369JU91_HYPMA|nr:hypothetical protein Hypma_009247 [Hypsizygus marmoreus]